MKKLTSYITREQIAPFFISFLFFTFILMLNRIFVLTDLIINKKVEILLVVKLFLLMLPVTMSLTIPMAVLISVIMALGRLSADSEIIALRACGISLFRIIKPVIIYGFIIFILMIIFQETVLVYSNKNYNRIFLQILKSSPAAMIEEGIFTDLGDKTIWIEKINRENGRLKNIMLYKRNSGNSWDVIKSEYGEWKRNKDGSKTLNLFRGSIFSSDIDRDSFSIIDFSKGNAEILLTGSKIDFNEKKELINPSEMNSRELYSALCFAGKTIKNQRDISLFWVEFFKKHAIPFSCFVFVIIGAPIGISNRRSARGIGFGISIIVFFAYYIFFMTGQSLAIKGNISPFIGVWTANIVLLIAGIIIILLKEKVKFDL